MKNLYTVYDNWMKQQIVLAQSLNILEQLRGR